MDILLALIAFQLGILVGQLLAFRAILILILMLNKKKKDRLALGRESIARLMGLGKGLIK